MINLRKNELSVMVYEDYLDPIFKGETEWIAALEKNARESPEAAENSKAEFENFTKP